MLYPNLIQVTRETLEEVITHLVGDYPQDKDTLYYIKGISYGGTNSFISDPQELEGVLEEVKESLFDTIGEPPYSVWYDPQKPHFIYYGKGMLIGAHMELCMK